MPATSSPFRPALPLEPPEELVVRPWVDPLVDRLGHDPRSAYVERFWLGILGPSSVWLLRRLAAGLEQEPEGFVLSLPDTARALGIAGQGGRHSPFMRTLLRCCQFGMAELRGGELVARRHLPPLTRRQLERLPEGLQAEHVEWERSRPSPDAADQQRRARQLALTLLELGEDGPTAREHLHRWRFHPAMAHEALAWAEARLAAPPASAPLSG